MPSFTDPLVLPVEPVEPRHVGQLDVYAVARGTRPAVVLVHGGPLPPGTQPLPRAWPVYAGYASLLAEHGAVGIMFEHRFVEDADVDAASADVATAVAQARELAEVDADRIALWFFSGGGRLSLPWLREPPSWLRCVALSYPVLPEGPWPVSPQLPIVLTRCGLERPELGERVDGLINESVGAKVHVVDVANGHHAFDIVDDTDDSRRAIRAAVDAVVSAVRA